MQLLFARLVGLLKGRLCGEWLRRGLEQLLLLAAKVLA